MSDDAMEQGGRGVPVWRVFLRGAISPSWPALAVTGLTSVLVFVFLCMTLTADFLAGPNYRYFLADTEDRWGEVTHRALSIKPSVEPKVVVLGNSLAVTCIAESDRLSSAIVSNGAPAPLIHNLSSTAQSTWEMAALIERIPSGSHGVLVVALAPYILGTSFDESDPSSHARFVRRPLFGFVSESYRQEAKLQGIDVPLKTGIYALDNVHYLLARRRSVVGSLLSEPPKLQDPWAENWVARADTEAFRVTEIDKSRNKDHEYDANAVSNLDVVQRFVETLNARASFHVIIMESPVNPRWHGIPDRAAFYARYRKDLNEFAQRHGYEFLNVTQAAKLEKDNFADMVGHLDSHASQDKCTGAVAKAVAQRLES